MASQFVDGFGLSQSSVSRAFVERSRKALERFESRSLAEEDFVALWVDGKTLASEQIVLAMGLRLDGTKSILGTARMLHGERFGHQRALPGSDRARPAL